MYTIKPYNSHVVIIDENDNIVSHCDNYPEAEEEIEELEKEVRIND